MNITGRPLIPTAFFVLSSIALAQSDAERSEVEKAKKTGTLKMIVAQMRGNYEALQTVSGEYNFSDAFLFDGQVPGLMPSDQVPIQQVTDPRLDKLISRSTDNPARRHGNERPTGEDEATGGDQAYWSVTRGVINLAFDCVGDRYHVFYEPRQPAAFNDIPTGRWYQWTTDGDLIHWMLTPEHFVEFDIDTSYGQLPEFQTAQSVSPRGGRVVIRQPPSHERRCERFVHFRDMYSDGLRLYHDFLEVFCSDDFEVVKLLEPGDDAPGIYTFIMKSSHGRIIIDLDEHVGFNVIKFQDIDENGMLWVQREISYRKAAGVFLPASYREEKYSETHPESVRQFDLISATINEPIDESEFSFDQFDLKYGERMHDQIENALAFYDGEKFVDSERFELEKGKLDWRMTPDGPVTVDPSTPNARATPPAPALEERSTFRLLLIGLNVLAIIVIAVFVLRQKQ